MRLNRLGLTRYGKFTDRSLNFGAPEPGKPDVHIVYGANEAGKSTALAAFLDLLFGIETRTRFNFLHPNDTMRVGGSLEIGGTDFELARVKRGANTLLDGNGLPIAEVLLMGQLGGIDRESYRAMFSLDDDTLEAGGESILASKGDLGQLLFSASAGLADLSRKLTELRTEADGFYRFRAHNTELARYRSELAALKEERERIDTAASRYATLIEAHDLAWQQYESAIAARGEAQVRMEEIRRLVSALPRLAALRAAQEQLLPLAALAAAPAGWHAALPALQNEALTLSVHGDALQREMLETTAALDAIVVDERALDVGGRLDRLNDLHARYVTADKDIPVRELEVRETDVQISGILGRIGRVAEPDPRRLVLGAATVGALQDLIARRSGVQTAVEGAESELSEARHRLQEAEAMLQSATTNVSGTALNAEGLPALAAVVAAVQGSDHAARTRVAGRAQAKYQDELAERLLALRPWLGDAERLATLAVPDEGDLQRWYAELNAAQNQHGRREQELERVKAERSRRTVERDAIVQVVGVVSDQEAATIRAAREAAWANHRHTLDTVSADAFETRLRHDDIVMNARLRHEADIARLHQIGEALARADGDVSHAQEEFDKALVRLQRIQDAVAAAAAPLLPNATLDALTAWLGRRDKAMETRERLRQAARDLHDAEADAEELRQRLCRALDAAGVAHDPAAAIDDLRVAGQAVLDREATFRALRDAVQDRRRDVQSRERRHKTANEREAQWQAAWAVACAASWLGEADASPSVATVREILAMVAELGPALEKRAGLLDRIEKMQADQRDYAGEVAAVALLLGWALEDGPPLELAQKIKDHVQDAQTAATLRSGKVNDLDGVHARQRDQTEAQRLHDLRAREMQAFFGVCSLADVAARLSDIARRAELKRQAEDAAQEIMDALRVASIDEAEQRLERADRAALEAELAPLQTTFDNQDRRARDLFSEFSKASDQVDRVGGDAAVARLEEQRRTVLLEIEERAMHYLRLRAGIVAAEHALRSYRQQHRSAMMTEASDAFRTISGGAYSGLASQPNKDSEDLITVGADGSSKVASQLSKGTRFQLYLALRVAGYREFARLRPPVPFIADDIMETFDNERAEQALRLLGRIGEVGQAIYLTHHPHLCEIARQVCPDVRLHQL
jgi:uncharacterized protein YhaN